MDTNLNTINKVKPTSPRRNFHKPEAELYSTQLIINKVLKAALPADKTENLHPYLSRKQMGPLATAYVISPSALQLALGNGYWPGNLNRSDAIAIFPYRNKDGITTLEFIDKDGQKRLLKGAVRKGSYWTVKHIDDPEIILVSEGAATASTCALGAEAHSALGKKRVLSVAAGGNNNIESAIITLRGQHRSAQIIVCCDLNKETREPDPVALAAANNTHSLIAVPDTLLKEEGKDFNDLLITAGSQIVGIALNSGYITQFNTPFTPNTTTAEPPQTNTIPNLPACVKVESFVKPRPEHSPLPDGIALTKGGRVLLSPGNAVLIVEVIIGRSVGFDEFTKKKTVAPAFLPWRDMTIFSDHYEYWRDRDTRMLELAIEKAYGITFYKPVLLNAVDTVIENHVFNNVRQKCIESKGLWDRVDRLSYWLATYLGVDPIEKEAYLNELGHAWLRGVIARIMYPGCQRDDVLVLIGPQGAGKSSVARAIGKQFGDNTYTNTVSNFHNKDAQATLCGKVIVELAEMSAARTSSIEEIKNFVATCADTFRPAYGREVVEYKRTCSFIATTNDEFIFKDITGNRRFWPIKVGKVDLAAFERDLPQLLAQAAYECIDLKLPWHITNEDATSQANNARDSYFDHDDWTSKVLEVVSNLMGTGICPCQDSISCKICEGTKKLPGANKECTTTSAIATAMGIPISQQTRVCFNRIRAILELNKFVKEKKRVQKGANPIWVWLPPITTEKDITPSPEVAKVSTCNTNAVANSILCKTCKWAKKASEPSLNGRIWCSFNEAVKATYKCDDFLSEDARCQDCYLAKDGKCQLSGSERLLVPGEDACGYFKGKDFKPPVRPVLPATSVNTMHNA